MHKLNRFVSSVVLAAFLINTVLTDISFANPSSATLSAAALCDDMPGVEHQDRGRITVAFQEILAFVSASHAGGMSITPLTFATILSDMSRQQPSVFAPPNMQFMYHAMTIVPETDEWHIECRVTDASTGHGAPKKYHVLFSFDKDALGGFPLRVVTDEEYAGLFTGVSINQQRDEQGRFKKKPGKEPMAVLRIISLDPSLQNEPVTVVDLLAAYQDWGAVLGYDELAPSRPDDTMLRDVKKLVADGCLEPVKGVRGGYTLTAHGRKMIAGYREENKKLLETNLNDLIPQTLSYAAEITPTRKLVVGVPKEIKPFAERVGMTPAGVKVLVSYGVKVVVERGAGREHFSDDEYRAAGAIMVNTPGEVWAQADIIKKVKEPLGSKELGINELELMRPGQIIYTYLHLASPDCKALTYTLAQKRVTGIAFETIVTEENGRPVTPALRPMSIIAGNLGGYFSVIYSLWSDVVDDGGRKVVRLTAEGREMMKRVKADYLNAQGFRRVAKGKAAVVLGGGVSGVRMAKILLKLGVSVTITDASPARVEELKRIFAIYGKQAEVALVSKDMNDVSPELLSKLKQADILGGCVLVPGAVAPQMNEWLLRTISGTQFGGKPKAIIDIAIDQGGNFFGAHSTYYSDPAFADEYGNKRFCVANMPDFVGGVASVELEKTTLAYNLALSLGFDKAIAMFPELAGGVNVYDGHLTIEGLEGVYPDIPQVSFAKQVPEAAPVETDNATTGRFTTSIIVPTDTGHPDLKRIQARKLRSDSLGGYYMQDLIVPKDPDRIFTVDELVGLYRTVGQKRIMVENDPAMTYASGHALTSIMKAAEYKYTIGLATGGTTEALRKLMGLGDMLGRLYDTSIDADKIQKICTLDNYYFMDYIKRNGFTDAEAEKILAIASYESEQLYMMIRNMMGGDVKPGFFQAPPGYTDKSWFDSAEEFKMMLAKYFCVERSVQLWQLHGIGTNSHDGFNEIYKRLRREIGELALTFYPTGELKSMPMRDGTDLAKIGLRTLPPFTKIPPEFSRLGMLRDDHATMISFIIQVQNNGHFNKLIMEILKKRGQSRGDFEGFHPFFLKFMGDNSLYDVDELITAIQLSTPEKLLNYTDNPKYHFKDMQDFVAQLDFLFEMYSSVPVEATTQGIGGILRRGSLALPDGTYPLQLFMASAAHKQIAVMRALMMPSEWSTASTVLHAALNPLLIATEESTAMVTDPFTMKSFIKVRAEGGSGILGLHNEIESGWMKTLPGRETTALLESGTPAHAGAVSRQGGAGEMAIAMETVSTPDQERMDIDSIRTFDEVYKGARRVAEKQAVYQAICDEIELASMIVEEQYKEGAIRTKRVGVIPGGEDGATLIMHVDKDTRERTIGVYQSFIDGIFRLAGFVDGNTERKAIIAAIIESAVMHEMGHSLEGYSSIMDLQSLFEEDAAGKRTNRDDAAEWLGIVRQKDWDEDTFTHVVAESLAWSVMGGKGNSAIIRNSAAYLFYKYFSFTPESFLDEKTLRVDEGKVSAMVSAYFAANPHLEKWTGNGADAVAHGVFADVAQFFGKGTPWHDVLLKYSRAVQSWMTNTDTVLSAEERQAEAAAQAAAEAKRPGIASLLKSSYNQKRSPNERAEARQSLAAMNRDPRLSAIISAEVAALQQNDAALTNRGAEQRMFSDTLAALKKTAPASVPPSAAVSRQGGKGEFAPAGSDQAVAADIAEAIAAAPEAARVIPTHPSTRFTLLVDYSFHKDNAELTGDMNGYVDDGGRVVAAGDRFDVERVEASNIENILAHVKDPARTVVQVSTTLSEGDLAALKAKAPGIRIVRVNTDEIRAATHDITDSAERQKNRFDMYAAMLAVRSLTPEELQNRAGGNYRILQFYVKTHFALSEGLTIDDYINAIATDDLTRLIKGHLAYRPIQVYRVPDYNSVAAALVSA